MMHQLNRGAQFSDHRFASFAQITVTIRIDIIHITSCRPVLIWIRFSNRVHTEYGFVGSWSWWPCICVLY